ncbi:hypothetical protein J2X20_003449 [Pelomonas saccharophila]|uniref:DUF4760 domain-containing protein n=1 Tax=Roseateles saccharophilus TaxID=304 RepID=A0ABU1YS37_ROSSA|nr:hypothetical protein [Roseateles saccharophilus]MDR7270791.1 hypothetical protein [Roseateles saccharophilus]
MAQWPTLEIAKLIVGVLTPLSVALLGWLFSRQLKRLDLSNWTNQKLIEKRLAIYDEIAPRLNQLLCFFTWVGYWKTISPADAIHAKRDLDKTLNIYRHVFEAEVYEAYQDYIHILFETYTSAGHDAKLRALVRSPDGDRRTDGAYAWSDAWNACFSEPRNAVDKGEVRARYKALMAALTRSLGVSTPERPQAAVKPRPAPRPAPAGGQTPA